MGITIGNTRRSFDMGYGGFANFRTLIAEQINNEVHEHYSNLFKGLSADRKTFFEIYNKKTRQLIDDGKLEEDVAIFLYAKDSNDKISRKIVKAVYKYLVNCDDSIVIGYCGRKDPTTIKDMKLLFSEGLIISW